MLGAAWTNLYLHFPGAREHQDDWLVDEGCCGDKSEACEPQPEDEIYLLVNNIDGEGAHSGVVLNVAAHTVVGHGALHHLWEDNIESLTQHLQREKVGAEAEELIGQDEVHDVHLPDSEH